MAGNHYLDPGQCYEADTPQTLRAQARYEKAEADRAAFEALGRKWADEAIKLAAARNAEPDAMWLKRAQDRKMTFPDLVREYLSGEAGEMFNLPDPQDEYDDEMGAE